VGTAGLPSAVLARLSPRLRSCLGEVDAADLEEIRLNAGRPLTLVATWADFMVTQKGAWTQDPREACPVTAEDVAGTLELMARSSYYALEEELRRGCLTLPGGHRVGMVGRALLDGGRLRTLRDVSGLNIRLAREVPGAASSLIPLVIGGVRPRSTLVLSPPRAGKTTVLRDLVRQLSDGGKDRPGYRVGLVDERSELAGCSGGVPQLDVGRRTDVLDGCPKVQGIRLLLRAMGPELIACDEIGGEEEAEVLADAARCGVGVLATAHAADLRDALARPALRSALRSQVFERAVVLSRRRGPGTVEAVHELAGANGPG